MRLIAGLLCALLAGYLSDSASAQPLDDFNGYSSYEPGERLALIIGNSSYSAMPDLDGVEADVQAAEQRFRALGFTPFVHRNLETSEKLQYDALVQFRNQVERDDLVVIYLSGHGFSYLGENYFMTSRMPSPVPADFLEYAFPISSLTSFFDAHDPGAVLLIFDACRVVINPGAAVAGTYKAPFPPQNMPSMRRPNYMIAWATVNGLPAAANADAPSLYTKHLLMELSISEERFDDLHVNVKLDVERESRGDQSPGLTDWSNTVIYLANKEKLADDQKEEWEASFATQDPRMIEKFVARNSLSPYVKSARRWLDDYYSGNSALTSYTRYSPLDIEYAWREANDTGLRVAVAGMTRELPFRHARIAEGNPLQEGSNPRVALEGAWPETGVENAELSQYLNTGGEVLVTEPFAAAVRPENDAVSSVTFEPGESVEISGITQTDEATWLSITSDEGTVSYLNVAANVSSMPVELFGNALASMNIVRKAAGLASLIDAEQLLSSMAPYLDSATEISWISIGINVNAADSEEEQFIKEQRALHARHLLAEAGIDTRRITIAPVGDIAEDEVSVKLFGYGRP